MSEALNEEVTRLPEPARGPRQASFGRQEKPASQSDAEHGGYTRLRQLATLGSSAQSPLERFARFFAPGEFSNSANHAEKARMLRAMQQQYGNDYVGRVLQRTCECGSSCNCSSPKQEELVQRHGEGEGEASAPSSGFGHAMQNTGTGKSLDPGTQAMMESRFGHSFADVRVHTDSAAETAAREIHAQAFTTGRDIYFGTARYQPQTRQGQHLLAHELAHVVQQRGGAVGSGMAKPVLSTPGDEFEREADTAAHQVMAGQAVSINGVTSGQPAPVQCAPADIGGKVAPKPCATATDFKQTAASDAGGGVLHFEYAWKSSTGKLPNLSECEVGEKVDYTQTADPPFAASPNPTIMWMPGVDGGFADNHSPGAVKPYKAFTEKAVQHYRYKCPCSNKGNPVNLLGPISITREITKRADGKFKYKITKSGKSAEIDPLT